MVTIGKHFVLVRQVGAAGVHQVDTGQAVLLCDFLRAQMFLDRQRVIGPALDRRVVAHHHAIDAADPADTGDQSGARGAVAAVAIRIHAQRRQRADFQKRRAGVEQHVHPFTGQQFAARGVFGPRRVATTELRFGNLRIQVDNQRPHGSGIDLKVARAWTEL